MNIAARHLLLTVLLSLTLSSLEYLKKKKRILIPMSFGIDFLFDRRDIVNFVVI